MFESAQSFMSAQSKKSEFLLLLRHPHVGPPPTLEEMKHIMAHFSEWMNEMRVKGLISGTNGLEMIGAVLRGHRGATITDGPYCESKEIVGGYVLIMADNLSHAVELARDCPGLDYRMSVEVRPVKQMRDG
jgi:hypothetical protein